MQQTTVMTPSQRQTQPVGNRDRRRRLGRSPRRGRRALRRGDFIRAEGGAGLQGDQSTRFIALHNGVGFRLWTMVDSVVRGPRLFPAIPPRPGRRPRTASCPHVPGRRTHVASVPTRRSRRTAPPSLAPALKTSPFKGIGCPGFLENQRRLRRSGRRTVDGSKRSGDGAISHATFLVDYCVVRSLCRVRLLIFQPSDVFTKTSS